VANVTLGELATHMGASLIGDAQFEIQSIAPLESAGPDQLSFAVGLAQSDALQKSQAGAFILPESLKSFTTAHCLIVDDAYAGFATASWLVSPESLPEPGIHATAVVAESLTMGSGVRIGAGAVIGADSLIGDGVIIGAGVIVGERVRIGAGTRLFARAVLGDDVHLGEQCRVQSGAVIGSEGFGYAQADGGWRPIHQVGGVRIGNQVHVGANTTIDCGALVPTVIESGVILDNQVQIAHNVQIGENTAIAGCTGIAGSTRIGRNCQIGGACNIVGHLEIADGVVLNATAFVSQSIDKPGRYGSGMPLQTAREWKRSYLILKRLDELLRRVRGLERTQAQAVSSTKH